MTNEAKQCEKDKKQNNKTKEGTCDMAMKKKSSIGNLFSVDVFLRVMFIVVIAFLIYEANKSFGWVKLIGPWGLSKK